MYIDTETKAYMPGAIGLYDVWHAGCVDTSLESQHKSWVGEECVVDFLRELEGMVKFQYEHDMLTRQKMKLTPQDWRTINTATACPKCKTPLTKDNKVRDHCHITGEFRGVLCSNCNTRLIQKRNILPVIFHNLKNYDMHILLKHGISHFKDWELTCIAQTTEKFMQLKAKVPVGKTQKDKTMYFTIIFTDSFQFMSSSLATLAENLTTLPHTHKMKDTYPTVSTDVLTRKGVFPYTYFSSLNVLRETSLPPRASFKNDLTEEECTEEDYEHAHRAWREFGCQTFRDYMLRYLELDVRLLADVFEEFRSMSLREDGLDPVHFVSLPGLTFQSAFKMTGETIHLLQDPHMFNLFERGIRGGLTFVNTHHAQEQIVRVGDKDMKEILLYIDQNNLYGAAMSEFLPHSDFYSLNDEEITQTFPDQSHIESLDTEGDVGYLFEVDLHYPPHIHKATSDFPLAPESDRIRDSMLSPYMRELYKSIQRARHPNRASLPNFKSSHKLLLSQNDKKNYVVHFKILLYYLSMGLQVTKIHKVVRFTQKKFLKPYIDFNSRQRALAKTSFEKDFYKLKNNSLFGKTMEDVRKHSNYKLANNTKLHNKYTASPLMHSQDIITPNLEGFRLLKPKVTLNKPVYIGQAVLDHSKLAMYTLFYKTLPSCPLIHNIRLLGGDTDSFFLALTIDQDKAASDILSALEQYVDFSNYPPTHPLHSNTNKAKLGCFKDELAGREIEEIVFLRPKMYSIKVKGEDKGIKKAKGIGKGAMRGIGHAHYQAAYHEHVEAMVEMTILRSVGHTVRTHTFSKRGLSCWDDKRVWVGANESVPHGSVESPVEYVGPQRVKPPKCGDVWSDVESDVDDDTSILDGDRSDDRHVVRPVQPLRIVENGTSDVSDVESDVSDVEDLSDDEDVDDAMCIDDEDAPGDVERGDAVGFDDEERSEEEEEEEGEFSDFINDDEEEDSDDDGSMLVMRRRREPDDVDFDVGALAKRVRLG